jgi:hypothetical protein
MESVPAAPSTKRRHESVTQDRMACFYCRIRDRCAYWRNLWEPSKSF